MVRSTDRAARRTLSRDATQVGQCTVFMRNPSTLERLILAAPRRPKWIFGARSRNAASERGKAVKIRRGRAAVTGEEPAREPDVCRFPREFLGLPVRLGGQPLAATRGWEGGKRPLVPRPRP